MRRKKDDSSSGYNWMDTYGDMVTLLLTFFVLLYSMSIIDAQKWQMLVQALRWNKDATETQTNNTEGGGLIDIDQSEGVTVPSNPDEALEENKVVDEVKEFDDLYYYLKQYIEKNGLSSEINEIKLYKGDGYTFIRFQDTIFFDGDSAVLKPRALEILDFLAGAVKNISSQIGEIRAYGHTARAGAANEPNTIRGDRVLSVMRATNVIIYLQEKNVIEPYKLVAEGYGENRPIVPHDGTEATRIKNRRVEIYISKADKSSITLDKIYAEINQAENSQ